jgi:hypothetical protein
MPVWQVDIQKQLGSEYWTNVYHVDVAGQAQAAAVAEQIAAIEQDIHLTIVTFVNYRVRPYPSGGAPGTVYPLGYNGQNPSGSYLPLWNTLNVVFQAATGRPSRKYLRIPIVEEAQSDGVLNPTYLASFQDNYAEPLQLIPELVDVDGQGFGAIRVLSAIGMRQLRRGSRRRVTPVI